MNVNSPDLNTIENVPYSFSFFSNNDLGSLGVVYRVNGLMLQSKMLSTTNFFFFFLIIIIIQLLRTTKYIQTQHYIPKKKTAAQLLFFSTTNLLETLVGYPATGIQTRDFRGRLRLPGHCFRSLLRRLRYKIK